MIKVIIADDQELIRESLKIVLGTHEDIQVVDVASDGFEVIHILEQETADVILMDIRMPGMDGVHCTKIVKEKYPQTKIIILTTFDDDDFVFSALKYGASGYLLTANGSNNAPTWDPYYWNFFTGTCSSSSTATTKTVTLSNNDSVFSLREGVIVSVKFTYSNSTSSSASRYLAVNGTSSCLIKDKYGNNFNGTVFTWNSGDTVLFQYRGGYWYTVTGITGNLISGTTTTENATYGNSIGDKIVSAWGRESSQFGRFTISRSNTSGDMVDVSGEEGYWKNQKLTGTAFIPNGEQVRIYQEKMDNITYWIKYLSY